MGSLPAGAGALVGKHLGSHEIVALLAVGGTAEIYLARIAGAHGFEKYVVVKSLHDHLADDPDFVQMFLDEARLGAQLDHSNIVQTLALGEQGGRYYLVMEFLAGLSLAMIGRRSIERVPGGKVPVPLVLGIAAQACTGLHYAHERAAGGVPLRIVHRDISPQNLVIGFEGVVKLVDFGIAKADSRATKTQAGTIKGKFAYMSPEQCLSKDVDRRADVFALGVVVHELLTGKRLFKRGSAYDTYQAILEGKVPPPSTVNRALDPELDPVVLRALAYDPDARYPTAEAFGEAMVGWLHRRGGHASAGDVARYLEEYFAKEIDEHVARMRELIEGHESSLVSWDGDPDSILIPNAPGGAPGGAPGDADEATPVEQIVFASSTTPSRGDIAGLAGEDADEATRIETDALAKILALEADAVAREAARVAALAPDLLASLRAPTIPDPPRASTSSDPLRAPTIPDPPRAPTIPPGLARPGSAADVVFAGAGSRRMTTIPEEPPSGLPAVPPPPAIVRTPPGLRDLGPRSFPPASVPTVITAEPSSTMPRSFDMAPELVPTSILHIDPGAPQMPWAAAGTPGGMPAASTGAYAPTPLMHGSPPMATNPTMGGELPLPAHLIGLPGYSEPVYSERPPHPGERAPTTVPVHLAARRPWLLLLAFLLAVAVALAATIGLARTLT